MPVTDPAAPLPGPGPTPTTTAQPGRGRLFVLSGPSGVGKSTVLAGVRAAVPALWYSVSATTRLPRPGEQHGVNYFFLTPTEFAEAVAAGQMLEHAHFAGNDYGTPRGAVEERLSAGQDVLLEIDVQGARQIRSVGGIGSEAVLIFLAPPSFQELADRLIGRRTESDEAVAARLAAAESELAAEPEFDHTVVNTSVAEAISGLVVLMAGPVTGR